LISVRLVVTHEFIVLFVCLVDSVYAKRSERIRTESDGLKSRAENLRKIVDKFEVEIQKLNNVRVRARLILPVREYIIYMST